MENHKPNQIPQIPCKQESGCGKFVELSTSRRHYPLAFSMCFVLKVTISFTSLEEMFRNLSNSRT